MNLLRRTRLLVLMPLLVSVGSVFSHAQISVPQQPPNAILKRGEVGRIAWDSYTAKIDTGSPGWAALLTKEGIAVGSDIEKQVVALVDSLRALTAEGWNILSTPNLEALLAEKLKEPVKPTRPPAVTKRVPSENEIKAYKDLREKIVIAKRAEALREKEIAEWCKEIDRYTSLPEAHGIGKAWQTMRLGGMRSTHIQRATWIREHHETLKRQGSVHREQMETDLEKMESEYDLSSVSRSDGPSISEINTKAEASVRKEMAFPLIDHLPAKSSSFHVLGGVRLVTPYKVTKPVEPANPGDPVPSNIDSGAPTLRPYLELGYRSYWVINPMRKEKWPGRERLSAAEASTSNDSYIVWPIHHFDIDGRMNFTLNDSAEKDAANIAGSSDVNAEINIDALFMVETHFDTAWSLGLGFRVGGSASRSDRRVHPDLFAGLRFNIGQIVSFEKPVDPEDPKTQMNLFRFGLGYSIIDRLNYVPGSNDDVVRFEGSRPDFTSVAVPVFEAEAWYPVNAASSVRLGVRFYHEIDPNPWMVYFGYTLNLDKIFGGFFGVEPKDQSKK